MTEPSSEAIGVGGVCTISRLRRLAVRRLPLLLFGSHSGESLSLISDDGGVGGGEGGGESGGSRMSRCLTRMRTGYLRVRLTGLSSSWNGSGTTSIFSSGINPGRVVQAISS